MRLRSMALPFLAEVRDTTNVPHDCDTIVLHSDTLSETFVAILACEPQRNRDHLMKKTLLLAGALTIVAAACSSSTQESPSTVAPETTTTIATTTTATAAPTTTAATTTSTTAPPAEEGDSGPEVDAIIAAYEIVFSSETSYDEKAPLIDDPDGLEETVAKYQETGDSMGGVALVAKTVIINGDTADVTYDLLFGGTPSYPDLKGDAVLIDGTWKVTRTMFCSLMSSARVGCPSS